MLCPPRMIRSLARPVSQHVALAVDAAQVAGVEPALLRPDPRVVLLAQVAREHRRTAHEQHADLLRRAVAQPPAVGTDHDGLHLLVRHREADRPDATLARRRVEARGTGGLGEPVALEDPEAGELLEPAEHLGRHGRRAAQRVAQRTHVRTRDRHLEQRGVDGRHGAEEIDAMALDQPPEAGEQARGAIALDAREQHRGPAAERAEAGADRAVDVEQRQPAEKHGPRSEADERAHAPGEEHLVRVRVLRDLGVPVVPPVWK